jgi:uncharacterized protein YdhG (YjbR/CyaY superfamily)
MKIVATTIAEYLDNVPEDKNAAFRKLVEVIRQNIPKGFEEQLSYGMIGFVVPHSLYPAGYHCNPKLPLPFVNVASQKNFIALYHMGIYAKPDLLKWFVDEFPKHSASKLDMGKSCIRFKKPDQIPFDLIAALMGKMSVNEWIGNYESAFKH